MSGDDRTGQCLAAAEILVRELDNEEPTKPQRAGNIESEGYVYHCYGDEVYLRHTVASVVTLRRYDRRRAVALYCPPAHQALLKRHGLDSLFHYVGSLSDEACSIVGFKHNLHKYKPFEKCLYLDSDMIWCKNPDRLWLHLAPYSFTATGLNIADAYFGGPKGAGVFWDWILNRRGTTMTHFGLTHLPRIQAGMIYAHDAALTAAVCQSAAGYLAQRSKTHFRSRLTEGRKEESCEWSLAMALSTLRIPIFPWFQGYDSPQLDFVAGLTQHDPAFNQVVCKLYCDRFVYSLRSLASERARDALLLLFSSIPGKGDFMEVTPFVIHFGSLRHKPVFAKFAASIWEGLAARDLDGFSGARHNDGRQQLACA
jgi:hypothetical protein